MDKSGFTQIGSEDLIGHPPVDHDVLRNQPFQHHGKPRDEGVPQLIAVLFARHDTSVRANGHDVITWSTKEAIIEGRSISPSDAGNREHAVLLQIEANGPGKIDLRLVYSARPADCYRRIRAYEPTATSEIGHVPLCLGYQVGKLKIVDKAMEEHVFIFDALSPRIGCKALRHDYVVKPKHAWDVGGAIEDRPFD